jgi:hypothetical protein
MFVSIFFSHIFPYNEGWIKVLWGLKFAQFLGPSLGKRIPNYEYKFSYESEYLEGEMKSQ